MIKAEIYGYSSPGGAELERKEPDRRPLIAKRSASNSLRRSFLIRLRTSGTTEIISKSIGGSTS